MATATEPAPPSSLKKAVPRRIQVGISVTHRGHTCTTFKPVTGGFYECDHGQLVHPRHVPTVQINETSSEGGEPR